MIRQIPNFILENQDMYKIKYDEKFIVSKSNIFKKDTLHLRNSTHIMILLINGSKVLHMDKKDIEIDTTDILYLSQGNYFMSEILGDKNKFESIVVSFDDDFIFDFIKKYKININSKNDESVLSIKRDVFIDSSISNMNDYFSSNLDNTLDLMKLKTHEIFLYTLSKNKVQFIAFLNHIVKTTSSRVKFILEENLDIINNIEDMCKLTRLNAKALRKEMQRLYLLNPKEWLDKKRLEKSVLLLKNTDKSISNIATSCGYSSVSWFIIQFKKHYKITPLLFREQNL